MTPIKIVRNLGIVVRIYVNLGSPEVNKKSRITAHYCPHGTKRIGWIVTDFDSSFSVYFWMIKYTRKSDIYRAKRISLMNFELSTVIQFL